MLNPSPALIRRQINGKSCKGISCPQKSNYENLAIFCKNPAKPLRANIRNNAALLRFPSRMVFGASESRVVESEVSGEEAGGGLPFQ